MAPPLVERTLGLRNRQHRQRVNLPLLRRLARHLFTKLLPSEPFALCLHLVDASEMARLNDQFLGHTGPTDVITFDHRELEPGGIPAGCQGEIFICLDVAVAQAREFKTTWREELVRYLVHGALHLHGHDDLEPAKRRLMKRHENRLVRQLARLFPLRQL